MNKHIKGCKLNLNSKLPEVIKQAECIKICIDQYHTKKTTKATMAVEILCKEAQSEYEELQNAVKS